MFNKKINLFNGDSLDFITNNIKDGSVDLILIDPPFYKVMMGEIFRLKSNNEKNFDSDYNWDSQWGTIEEYQDWLNSYAIQFKRVLKKNGSFYCFTDQKKSAYNQVIFDKYFYLRNINFWYKTNGFFTCNKAKYKYLNTGENILFYTHLKKDINTFNILYDDENYNLLEFPTCTVEQGTTIHPTQKPIRLLSYLIQKSTNENDLVLDCFGGSGSTAVACAITNRRCISIEKDKKYFDDSCLRLEKYNTDLLI
jgi:DNA modification methylase